MKKPKDLEDLPVFELTDPAPLVLYFLCKGDEVVYAGASRRWATRLEQHKREGRHDFDRTFYMPIQERWQEAAFIRACKPKGNVNGVKRKHEKGTGVYRRGPRSWKAAVSLGGHYLNLGTYTTKAEAIVVRKRFIELLDPEIIPVTI